MLMYLWLQSGDMFHSRMEEAMNTNLPEVEGSTETDHLLVILPYQFFHVLLFEFDTGTVQGIPSGTL